MKRILAIILSIVLLLSLSLCACGNNKKAEKYCSSCGEGISKDVSVCEHCGAAVNSEKTESKDTSNNNSSSTESKNEETSKPTSSTSTPSTNKPSTPSNSSTNTPSTSKPSTPTHTHSYSKKVTAATCTEKGYTTYTCSCGETYKDNYTNPSHSYVKYICSVCNSIDKTHAYEYLIESLKKDGTVDGDCVSFTHTTNDCQYSVTYNATKNYAYVSVLMVGSTPNDRNDDSYVLIDLSGKGSFNYATYYGNTTCYGEGIINGSTYSENSPLPMSKYNGSQAQKYWFNENSRLMVNLAITFLSDFINQCIPGITAKDIGFKNF